MARGHSWTKARRRRFLKELAATANVSASASAAGMSPSSAYRLRRLDAAFAEAWQDALDIGLDALEDAVMKRAIDGVEKTHFHAGKPVGTSKSYSDALAMFLLKAHRPQVYGEAKDLKKDAAASAAPDPVAELEARLAAIERRQEAPPAPDREAE
jgi:hypothetical protein